MIDNILILLGVLALFMMLAPVVLQGLQKFADWQYRRKERRILRDTKRFY